VPGELTELTRSVFRYGLRDMSTLNRDSPQQREELRRDVEEVIALFEPRLTRVRVTLVVGESKTEDRRDVRFLIEGLLRVDPAPERVIFDTVLEPASGGYQVREAFGA
jgi:type VI secretion system protein ImpF